MSNLPNISITHQFNGDTAATGKVNTSDLDTQLGNLATNDNLQKAAIDRITNGDNDLAAQIVGFGNLKPELTFAFASSTNPGWQPKVEVATATTANITLSGEQTLDGILTSASRVLVKNQTTQSQNGIYVSAAGAWARSTDMDVAAEFVYAVVTVTAGAMQIGSTWVTTNATAPTVGTTSIVWAEVVAPQISSTLSGAGLSVKGVAGSSAAAIADIVAGTDGHILRRSGSTLGFGQIVAAGITDATITNAKLANVATATFKGRTTAGTGVPEDMTATQATALLNVFVGDSGAGGTKGLVPAPAVGDQLKILKGGGTFGVLPFYAGILNSTELAITAAGAATISRMHVVSGTSADYTITIPTAVGQGGNIIGFHVKEYASANKQFILDANASETIDGVTTLTLLHTNSILLYSDNANWWSISKSLDTPWIDGGAMTITGSTSNPTKGTMTRDKIFWRRVGDSVEIRLEYRQSSAGLAGSGIYLFTIPNGFLADTNKVQVDTEVVRPYAGEINLGSFTFSDTSNFMAGMVSLYSTSKVRVNLVYDVNNGAFGIFQTLAVASSLTFSGSYTVPIAGW